ncbi:MAG: T9SS type A sorting domain-containing protein, partial [Bacteroidota bacterium]
LPYQAADLSVSKPNLQFQSINGGQSLTANSPFEVIVELRDRLGNLLNASADMQVDLTVENGNGNLEGSSSASISSGNNSVTFSNLVYDRPESDVIFKAMIAGNDSIQAVLSDSLSFERANLVITSVNSGTSPILDSTFSITVKIQTNTGQAVNARSNTNISLSVNQGLGNLGGSTNEIINAGSDSVVFNNLTYNVAEPDVVIQAQASSGDLLNAGLSSPFDVTPILALPGFLSSGSIDIFPNPHVDKFRIELEGELQPQIQFYIYDRAGKLVFSDKGQNRNGQFEVDLGHLPSGDYVMVLQVGDEFIARRIIRNR